MDELINESGFSFGIDFGGVLGGPVYDKVELGSPVGCLVGIKGSEGIRVLGLIHD